MVYGNQGNPVALRHGGLGIASFVIGVLSIFIDIGIFAVAGYMQMSGRQTPAVNVIVGASMLLLLGVCLLGIGLGIAGAVDRTSKKAFPVLGIVLSTLVVLITAGLVTYGIMKVRGMV